MPTEARFLAALAVLLSASTVLAQPAPTGRLISAAQLAQRLNDPTLVVLHVVDRSSSFEEAHIPGARPVRYDDVAIDGPDGIGAEVPPLSVVERVFEAAGVSDASHVVLYGNTVAAARVFFTLDVAGHERVMLLDGGLRTWQAEKRPVATGAAPTVKPGTWTPRLRADRVADAQSIQQQAARLSLVDVRPDPEFTGTDGGMGGMHSPGHIDGARQLPWNTLVASDGKFLAAEELRGKLAAAGADGRKPLVAYCMVGMRASVVYFVARHLGLDVKLYDGSIVDWSRRRLPTTRGR